MDAICKRLAAKGYNNGHSVGPDEVRAAIGKFCDLGLMLEEKNAFLSLAIPVNRHW